MLDTKLATIYILVFNAKEGTSKPQPVRIIVMDARQGGSAILRAVLSAPIAQCSLRQKEKLAKSSLEPALAIKIGTKPLPMAQ